MLDHCGYETVEYVQAKSLKPQPVFATWFESCLPHPTLDKKFDMDQADFLHTRVASVSAEAIADIDR